MSLYVTWFNSIWQIFYVNELHIRGRAPNPTRTKYIEKYKIYFCINWHKNIYRCIFVEIGRNWMETATFKKKWRGWGLMHVGGCGYPGKSCHTRYKNIWHFMSNRFLNLYLCIRVSTSILAIWWHIWSHILQKNQTWKGLSSPTKSTFVCPNFHISNIQIFESICTWWARPYQFTKFNLVFWAFDEVLSGNCRRTNTAPHVGTLGFSPAITRSENEVEAVFTNEIRRACMPSCGQRCRTIVKNITDCLVLLCLPCPYRPRI